MQSKRLFGERCEGGLIIIFWILFRDHNTGQNSQLGLILVSQATTPDVLSIDSAGGVLQYCTGSRYNSQAEPQGPFLQWYERESHKLVREQVRRLQKWENHVIVDVSVGA